MRIKGTIIRIGDVKTTKLPGDELCQRQTIVIGYGSERQKTATIEVVGSEKVKRLQKLKVGDPLTIEFRRKWYLIMRNHILVYANSVEIFSPSATIYGDAAEIPNVISQIQKIGK